MRSKQPVEPTVLGVFPVRDVEAVIELEHQVQALRMALKRTWPAVRRLARGGYPADWCAGEIRHLGEAKGEGSLLIVSEALEELHGWMDYALATKDYQSLCVDQGLSLEDAAAELAKDDVDSARINGLREFAKAEKLADELGI
jgi:hypothetical protein